MTDRQNVKYQIFVSSTYDDLQKERQQAIKAILEMGHIPVGMEMFSAGDESQWQLIQRQIDDCDYYIVIVAHRYGSMDGEISYTEKEYNYAVQRSIPVLGFILDDKAKWAKVRMDNEPRKLELLNAFKGKIRNKLVDNWSTSQELKSKVAIALIKQMNINPRDGYVKSSKASSPEILNEIGRLSKENASLREKIKELSAVSENAKKTNKEKVLGILRSNTAKLWFAYEPDKGWENEKKVTYESLFLTLSPQLMVEKSLKDKDVYLGLMYNPDVKRNLRGSYPVPQNTVKAIFADFHILDLVSISDKPRRKAEDSNEYWTMSEFGKQIYSYLRISQLEKGINKTSSTPLTDALTSLLGSAAKVDTRVEGKVPSTKGKIEG
jgi:hypothetical protein